MAGLQTLDKNPEALHDICQDKGKQVNDKFVNPGTPETPLVSMEQMTKATIRGNGSDILKANLIK